MHGRLRHLAALGSLVSVSILASAASADLPPPDGRKFVGYAFRVEGAAADGDWVLLAYPASDSNGRPQDGYKVVQDGMDVSVGRRSGAPQLYAMKRTDYDAFAKTYKPGNEMEDPVLRDVFKSDKVVACDLSPTPVHEVDSKDARSTVVESMKLVSVDAKKCHVVAASDTSAPSPSSVPSSTPDASPEASAAPIASSATPESSAAPDAPKSGGCAGCSFDGEEAGGSTIAALLGAAALVIASRRRGRP